MKNQVFLDPYDPTSGGWRVAFNGKICTPDFNSKGSAQAYLSALEDGKRKPEYANS